MENIEKSGIIAKHFQNLGQDAPFMLRASGKFECWDGFEIPDDETLLVWKAENEEFVVLKDQEKELLQLIKDNEYHLFSKRKKMIADRDIWEDILDTWDDELTAVKDQLELLKEGKAPGPPIAITAKPVLNGG